MWLLAVGLVLSVAGLFGAAVGAARVARHEARAAVDLGALAGAARALDGAPAACTRAAEITSRNGGRVTGCELDGLDLVLTVEMTVEPLPGWHRHVIATARAGPVRS